MALQLKSIANKLLHRNTLQLMRNKSRASLPSLIWEDPFRHSRSLFNLHPMDFWKSPDPWELLFPSTRYTAYMQPSALMDGEQSLTNSKDGFQVALNVQQFAPNEISVKVVDNSVIVEAKHEERSDEDGYVSRHFRRRYVLPEEYNIKDVVSTLSSDGILTVKAPPKEIDEANVRNINIQQTGPAHLNISGGSKGEVSQKDDKAAENKADQSETKT